MRKRDMQVNKSTEGSLFLSDVFLNAEDEASIINFYLNSLKPKKDDKKKGNGPLIPASDKGGFKSMKELIAETLKENEDRKE